MNTYAVGDMRECRVRSNSRWFGLDCVVMDVDGCAPGESIVAFYAAGSVRMNPGDTARVVMTLGGPLGSYWRLIPAADPNSGQGT